MRLPAFLTASSQPAEAPQSEEEKQSLIERQERGRRDHEMTIAKPAHLKLQSLLLNAGITGDTLKVAGEIEAAFWTGFFSNP